MHTERLKAKQAKMPSISLDRTFCVPSKKHPQHFPYLSLPYAEILKPYKIPRSFLCVNHFRKHQGPRENPKALDLLVSHHPKFTVQPLNLQSFSLNFGLLYKSPRFTKKISDFPWIFHQMIPKVSKAGRLEKTRGLWPPARHLALVLENPGCLGNPWESLGH